jgi:protein-S-isoprenylcysteine O-methyltransferase Ste14
LSALELKIPPVAVTILYAVLMYLLARVTPDLGLPFILQLLLAVVLSGAGAVFGLGGVQAFRRARTSVNPLNPHASSTLVATGIFRWSRNPMYLALLLLLLAWGALLDNGWALLLAASFVPYMNRFQIGPEERALETVFGPEFTAYRRQVRRWL